MVKENSKSLYIKVKDYSVSGEYFELITNLKYGFLETTPQPILEKLSDYYQSEDYISHTDSKRNLFEKAYHLVRKISLKKKLNLINKYSKDSKNLLDIGSGTGDFLQTAQQNNWNVSGIEPNEQARNIANIKTNNSVFKTEQLTKLEAFSFDVITLWHVLEHLPNLQQQIKEIKNKLKPNGVLVVAVPNHMSYDAKYYKNYWAAYDAPRHLWHFNKDSIARLFLNESMKVVKIKPMLFDAFYVSMLSEKYKSGKMKFIKGFLIGLISNSKAMISKEHSSLIYIIKNN